MLYVFTGSDTVRAKTEVRKRAKKAELVIVGEGGVSFSEVPTLIASQGLFSDHVVYLLDRPLETAEGKELLDAYGKTLHESDVEIFVIASALSATEKKIFPKGATFETFDVKTKAVERPNVFAFSDSFLSGDKKKTWIGYRKLLNEGIAVEEIHGVLLWAVRSALLAAKSDSAVDAGLKPFVFSKSKRVAEARGVDTLEAMSRTLIQAYHYARSGRGTLELQLEQVILEK